MRNRSNKYLFGPNPKVLQSWSKYNLYHLRHLRLPPQHNRSFFQQKWSAKSLARGYHGEQVRERQWERLFSKRLRSVVPMDARYLGRNDGSLESAGRGSGLERPGRMRRDRIRATPFMQMTFAPLERRLDVAIFRALFASSARQARQFVVHGAVRVNGQKMRYPGYLLNPGDMFQVDPEMVMYATGAPKDSQQRRSGRGRRQKMKESRQKEEEVGGEAEAESAEAVAEATQESAPKKEENEKSVETEQQVMDKIDPREALRDLLSHAKEITTIQSHHRPSKHRADIQEFRRLVRRALANHSSETEIHDLEGQWSRLQHMIDGERQLAKKEHEVQIESSKAAKSGKAPEKENQEPAEKAAKPKESLSTQVQDAIQNPEKTESRALLSHISGADLTTLKQALYHVHQNPIDASKPYATPWRPRNYMSAFAFIPRYLEVNQSVCAAVYLRHPVARPGHAEVPTPFPESISGTAFAWYLRRR